MSGLVDLQDGRDRRIALDLTQLRPDQQSEPVQRRGSARKSGLPV
jgi:hypothetical protein